MDAFRGGRLQIRHNLHLGVGFLAATSGMTRARPAALRAASRTRAGRHLDAAGRARATRSCCCTASAATKASFLPTVAALADELPGDRDRPARLRRLGQAARAPPTTPRFFARAVVALLDALGLERAHLVGNSMGGRVAIEVGLRAPRPRRAARRCWRRRWPGCATGRWAPLLRRCGRSSGLIQPAPRPVVEAIVRRLVPGGDDGWSAAGVDEFLRAYLTPRGRAAFYAAARNIYLEEPRGRRRLLDAAARRSQPTSLFVWGRQDRLVPIAFARHVRERAARRAQHVELDCGHVPQLEAPRETHAAIGRFLRDGCERTGSLKAWSRVSAPPHGFVRMMCRPSSSRIRALSRTRFGPTRTSLRNGRFRSRASRFLPRKKSTRRTCRVPAPISHTRTRWRPSRRTCKRGAAGPAPSGAAGRRAAPGGGVASRSATRPPSVPT